MPTTFDPAAIRQRATELEKEMEGEAFWQDRRLAAQKSAEHARLRRHLEELERAERELAELAELALLAEGDPALEGELQDQLDRLAEELETLEERRLFRGRYDQGPALLTVNAGAGGTDAQDWAEMVLRMESRWAQRRGFEVTLLDHSPGEEAGIKSATIRVDGEYAYGLAKAERGVHRLVRLSPFDSAHRRHTSFAGVEVAPVVDEDVEVEINEEELRIDTYRSQGAGGQHVNKTDSAVRITHLPTGIVVQCQNERSQLANRQIAMTILRARLAALREREREEELAKERGESRPVDFGSQIRSYVLHPYTLVKDHRTGVETGDVQRVLDGDLDPFIRAYLHLQAEQEEARSPAQTKRG